MVAMACHGAVSSCSKVPLQSHRHFPLLANTVAAPLLKSPSPVLGLKVDVTLHQQRPGTCLDHLDVLRGSGKAPKLGLGLLDLDRTSGRGSWKDWGDWNDLDVAKVSPGNHRLDGFLPCIFGLTYVLTRVQVTSGSFFVNHHVNHVYEPRNRCVTCNL